MLEKSLWNMKNEELLALLAKYELAYADEPFNRKEVIEMINQHEMNLGALREACEAQDDGPLGPVRIKRKYVDIIFSDQEEEGKYRFFGLNGHFYWLPVRCKCRIPEELFTGSIEQCVMEKTILRDVGGKKLYREIKVPRFSYTVVGRGEI